MTFLAGCGSDEGGEENVCGGDSDLFYEGQPVDELGGECGPCDDGELGCEDSEQVACFGASPADECPDPNSTENPGNHNTGQENACGGTGELTFEGNIINEPGGSCGPCDDGTIICDGEEDLQCSGASAAGECPEENICGGTAELTYDGETVTELGASCGPCDDGEISCDGQDQLQCSGASPAETCLPTGTVEITATHSEWDYPQGQQKFSVYFLEGFNRDCHEAIDELSDASVLHAVDGDESVSSPIEATAENIPVDVDYTAVVVLYAEHSDVPVATTVGCEDVTIAGEDDVVEVDDLQLYELPSQLADEYRFRVSPVSGSGVALDRLIDLAVELRFDTEEVGTNLFDCWAGLSPCSSGTMGAIPYVIEHNNWDEIEAFMQFWNMPDLMDRLGWIEDFTDDITDGSPEALWFFFVDSLNEEWDSVADGGYGIEQAELGDIQIISMDTLTMEFVAQVDLQSDWEDGHMPWESALRRDVSFTSTEMNWIWGQTYGCDAYEDVPSFDDSDCEFNTVTADDVSWADPDDAEVTVRSFGWQYVGLRDVSIGFSLTDLVGHIWDDHISRLESELPISQGELFSRLFDCNRHEGRIRASFIEERDDDYWDFTDAELDALIDTWKPFCEEFAQNGQDFFAGAIKSFLVDHDIAKVNSSSQLVLEDNSDQVDSYLFSDGPDFYPTSLSPWSRPLFDSATYESSECNYYFYDDQGSDPFEFCAEPEIEAVSWSWSAFDHQTNRRRDKERGANGAALIALTREFQRRARKAAPR